MIAATGLVILLKLDSNRWFFSPCDLEIPWMTSKNYRAPLLHNIKLCASFQTPWWKQTGDTVRKPSIRVKIGNFLSCVTLKFDGWPWKKIEHLFYVTFSFVNHFKAISELKLNLQSGNSQFGSKSAIFVWCDLDIWWMTLKNNRAPLLCYVKLCASFQSHRWIQTEVIVQKRPIWVKIDNSLSRVTLKFDGWPWKTIRHLFYATSSFVHHFIAIGEFKPELQSENTQCWSKLTTFLVVWPWNLTDDLEKQYSKQHQAVCIISSSYVNSNWKWLSWVLTSVTLTFDLWPWPFAWNLLWS